MSWLSKEWNRHFGDDNNNPPPYVPPATITPVVDPTTGATTADTTTAATTPAATTPAASTFDATPYRSNVDSAFSQFTPEFYANRYAQIYDPYKTGVANQYGAAKDALTAGLAGRGLGNSQQGLGLFQQLDALRDQSLTAGQTAAQNFQTSLTDQVNTAKNNLYGSIGEGKDNASVGTSAQTEAQRIAGTATPASTLGNDLFGSFIQPYVGNNKSIGSPVNPDTQAFATGGSLNLAGTGGGGPAASTSVVGNKKKKF